MPGLWPECWDLPALVLLYDIFEQNNTSYTVSEYSECITLETRLQQAGRSPPVGGGPSPFHAADGHADLAARGRAVPPGNLPRPTDHRHRRPAAADRLRHRQGADGEPPISSPSSWRATPRRNNTVSMRNAGPPADVYGLAATIFRTLTGNPPPVASNRARTSDDLFVPGNVARDMPDHVAAALFNALQVRWISAPPPWRRCGISWPPPRR